MGVCLTPRRRWGGGLASPEAGVKTRGPGALAPEAGGAAESPDGASMLRGPTQAASPCSHRPAAEDNVHLRPPGPSLWVRDPSTAQLGPLLRVPQAASRGWALVARTVQWGSSVCPGHRQRPAAPASASRFAPSPPQGTDSQQDAGTSLCRTVTAAHSIGYRRRQGFRTPKRRGSHAGVGPGGGGVGTILECVHPPPRKQPHQGPPGRLLRLVKLGLPWGLLWSRPSSLPPRCGHHFHWLMATGPLDPSSQRGLGHRAWGQATRSETHRKQRANPHRQPWRAERVSDGVCSGGELPCGT